LAALRSLTLLTLLPPASHRRSDHRGQTADFIENACPARGPAWRKLLFALSLFHASVIERRKYGPLGWNIPYVFTTPDLKISCDQLVIFINALRDEDPVPYAALAYLAGECNYGGRVTDDKDRRLILNILGDFYREELMDDAHRLSESGTYYAPKDTDYEGYLTYIRQLPFQDAPDAFGMHANANITCAMNETRELLGTALSLQPRESGGGGKSWADVVTELASGTERSLPPQLDLDQCLVDFPITYDESMNTVLSQEMLRFNDMTVVVKRSLTAVQKAVKGLVVMSTELEAMGNSMANGEVPAMWSAIAYVHSCTLPLLRLPATARPRADPPPPTAARSCAKVPVAHAARLVVQGPCGALAIPAGVVREQVVPRYVLDLGILLHAGFHHGHQAELRPPVAPAHRRMRV
jgi:dynein heavy chain